jgi:hypothetical protein
MKEFNLERALAGEPVITRNGKKVTELHLFKNEALIQPLYGTIEGDEDVLQWTTFGIFNPVKETSWDLFMAEQKKSIWVNVYKLTNGEMCIGCSYSSLKDAMRYTDGDGTYLKTIEITNEV